MEKTLDASPSDALQKLTLNVPGDVIEKAKIKAIKQKTSISKIVTDALKRYVEEVTND